MPRHSRSYKSELYKSLQNDAGALLYLQVALEESVPDFLKALRHVAEARKISALAEASNLNRENLYRILSEDGNPRLNSLAAILKALGFKLSVESDSIDLQATSNEASATAFQEPAVTIPFSTKGTVYSIDHFRRDRMYQSTQPAVAMTRCSIGIERSDSKSREAVGAYA